MDEVYHGSEPRRTPYPFHLACQSAFAFRFKPLDLMRLRRERPHDARRGQGFFHHGNDIRLTVLRLSGDRADTPGQPLNEHRHDGSDD